ncbi:hypothetical protein HMPREF1981_03171 [Bacteroides pyogenes F0041]|uniref:Uncharacterized protein n=1 Tax=Bacteroides pyogenes F0041 TaxID=1321819 RepID=U2DIT8_9BACE|nr:hypothetical protein HMPREF1981_03171 [Bacteroides pyogenes F0041]
MKFGGTDNGSKNVLYVDEELAFTASGEQGIIAAANGICGGRIGVDGKPDGIADKRHACGRYACCETHFG